MGLRTAAGPCIVAEEPGSYDLPDFSALGNGPYPPILLEAFERAGNEFVAGRRARASSRPHCTLATSS